MSYSVGWIVLGCLAASLAAWQGLHAWALRRHVRARLAEPPAETTDMADEEQGFLTRWLFLAGFRRQGDTARFVLSTAGLAVVGGALLYGFYRTSVPRMLTELASAVPGGVGDLLAPLAMIAPWFLYAEVIAIPWLYVRSRRRSLLEKVQMDLPLFLDLLATLSQSGLSFDMAVSRILKHQPADRPLVREFRLFQAELLAGRTRIRALRGMAERLDVLPFSVFVSAIVQAEQMGAGIAEVLRWQADDLRERRREQALAMALATPTKLIVPMVACFLPGIFVLALGPVLLEFINMAGGLFRQAGG